MFSFAADLSNFHSVCVAKERALAEAQRRVKEAEREVHKTDLEIEDLVHAGNQYTKEAGGIAKTLDTLMESLEAAKVMQLAFTKSSEDDTGAGKAPLRPSERAQQVAEEEAHVAAFRGEMESLAKEIAQVKALTEKALSDKAKAERRLALVKEERDKAGEHHAVAKKAAEKAAAELKEEERLTAELKKKVEEKRAEKAAVAVRIRMLKARAEKAQEGAAKAKAEAAKILEDAEEAAKAKVAAARAKAQGSKKKMEEALAKVADMKSNRQAVKEKTATLKARLADVLAKKKEAAKKLDEEKTAVAAMAKKKEQAAAKLAEKVKERQDSEEYAQKELAKIAEKRRQREAERPLLEQRMAAAEKAKARAEAGAERMRRLWATAVVQQEENAAGDLEGLVMAIPGGREAVVAAFLATVELGPLDASQERWAARLTQEAARGGAGPAGWAAVDIGVQEGEKEVRVIRKQHALLKSKLAELAAAQEEKAAKEAVLSREEDDETQDGEDGGEGEEDGDGPEASALAAGEVALATLEAQLAVKEGSLKASARVLAGAGEGAGGDGHDNEMEEGEESKGRDSVVEGEEMRRRASTEVRKVRFSEPLDNREQTERLAAYREECEEGCQQAVKALEKELKALDLAVAQQEEAVEREMAGEAAEVDEALASLREEKAAVMLKLKELEA